MPSSSFFEAVKSSPSSTSCNGDDDNLNKLSGHVDESNQLSWDAQLDKMSGNNYESTLMSCNIPENEVYDMYNNDDESTKLAGPDAILDSKPPFQHDDDNGPN